MSKAKRHDTDEPVAASSWPRIEPGFYEAICYKTEIGVAWGYRRNLYVLFKIYDGDHDGTELFMTCNYPSKGITYRYKIYTQWSLAMGRKPYKGEKISGKAFPKKLYLVEVRDTIIKHRDGRPMPNFMQYSVIDSIIEVQTGVEIK